MSIFVWDFQFVIFKIYKRFLSFSKLKNTLWNLAIFWHFPLPGQTAVVFSIFGSFINSQNLQNFCSYYFFFRIKKRIASVTNLAQSLVVKQLWVTSLNHGKRMLQTYNDDTLELKITVFVWKLIFQSEAYQYKTVRGALKSIYNTEGTKGKQYHGNICFCLPVVICQQANTRRLQWINKHLALLKAVKLFTPKKDSLCKSPLLNTVAVEQWALSDVTVYMVRSCGMITHTKHSVYGWVYSGVFSRVNNATALSKTNKYQAWYSSYLVWNCIQS